MEFPAQGHRETYSNPTDGDCRAAGNSNSWSYKGGVCSLIKDNLSLEKYIQHSLNTQEQLQSEWAGNALFMTQDNVNKYVVCASSSDQVKGPWLLALEQGKLHNTNTAKAQTFYISASGAPDCKLY